MVVLPDHRIDLVAPPDAPVAVLVLHPHPDMGGTRHDPVVEAVVRAATDRGWASCRFDFSSSDVGTATAEAAAALDLLPDAERVGVVGYSFGAAIAARLDDPRLTAWSLVAPPFGVHYSAADLPAGNDERPTLILSPVHDQFCPLDAARQATHDWQATTVEPVEGVDHFLLGRHDEVARRSLDRIQPS